jgi:hypothetical protein
VESLRAAPSSPFLRELVDNGGRPRAPVAAAHASRAVVSSICFTRHKKWRDDLEVLKTHLSSNQNSLEAREETRSIASLSCSAFINDELLAFLFLVGGSAS